MINVKTVARWVINRLDDASEFLDSIINRIEDKVLDRIIPNDAWESYDGYARLPYVQVNILGPDGKNQQQFQAVLGDTVTIRTTEGVGVQIGSSVSA